MYKSEPKLILGLETGIDGGSLSILENGKQIAFASGSGNVSKSEDLLLLLETLLEKNSVKKADIKFIAVSDAPGSLTGVRIGLAIAKGLGDALGAEVKKISILDAMAALSETEGSVISALVTNRNVIYCREYKLLEGTLQIKGEIVDKLEYAEFVDTLKNFEADVTVVVNEELKSKLEDSLVLGQMVQRCHVQTLEDNLAAILGKAITAKCVR
jgi:tRNA threonylcarbamoyladenosine biosynthesis protein TsaB